MIRNIISGIAVSAVFLSSAASATAPGQADTLKSASVSNNRLLLAQSTSSTAAIEDSIFRQINQYRASQRLPALTRNATIDAQARTHSQKMANGQVKFGHSGFEQRVKAIATTIPYRSAAENVAYNQGFSDPATKAVQGWLKSPGHLGNIRGNYNLTGIGVARNSKGEVYFTQIFILRR
jgi:uncharacterized protein YkwD